MTYLYIIIIFYLIIRITNELNTTYDYNEQWTKKSRYKNKEYIKHCKKKEKHFYTKAFFTYLLLIIVLALFILTN